MNLNTKLLALYGLKFNPFTTDIPIEALYVHPRLESFLWRIENAFIRDGGFALISGEPGTGKSVALRLLTEKLNTIRDVQIGVITHSSANLADFYRELGDVFSVPLSSHNRWHGFKNLRQCWLKHLESTLLRPILFIDEAQEMHISALNELRLLSSMTFDSKVLLSVILAGDKRLNDKLSCTELLPLGSRIRIRLNTEYASPELLMQTLSHLITEAGNPNLMTQELMLLLCEHAMGNYRALCVMANELLAMAAQQERAQLDEKLYFDCFAVPTTVYKRKKTT
jgi:general secretion pathway protein A